MLGKWVPSHELVVIQPSLIILDFWRCSLLTLTDILEQSWRNMIQIVSMNNFSSNIFPSTPYLVHEKMGEKDVICSSLGVNA
jgi:hypothetical protein